MVAPRAERRTVTVLFVDMVGFTRLATRLDPEDVADIQSGYFAAVSAVIRRYGGIVEKYVGDAVMAVFGVPRCDRYDAYRAVLAGLRLPLAVAGLSRPDGQPVRVRIGIATGEAVVEAYPTDGGQRLASGDVVNRAARLQAYAAVGTVLVDAGTHRATRGVVAYRALGPITVAGKPEPLDVWRPLAGRVEPEHVDAVPLVGRAGELATLARHVAAALSAGSPGPIRLVGPAGSGRSRLVRELRRYPGIAAGDGVRWRIGGCQPGGGYDPDVAQLLRRAVRDAAEHPTVLVVEDVHWAAPALVARLRTFAADAAARRAPLAVILTSTTDLPDEPAGAGARVRLRDLTTPDTRLLLYGLLRRARLPATLAGRLVPLVHGNPGYAEAYVRMLAESGPVPGELPVPDPVRAAVSARIDRLTVPDRAALLVACTVGPVVSGDLLAYLLPATREQADRILRRLAYAGMLVERGERYAFADPVVRAVGYARLPRRTRADLERRAAGYPSAHPSPPAVGIPVQPAISLLDNGFRLMSDQRPARERSVAHPTETMDRWPRTVRHRARSPTSTAGPRSSPR